MSPSIQEASQTILGASVLRDRFQEKKGISPGIDKILENAIGAGETYKKIQSSILFNGRNESRILNAYKNEHGNDAFLVATVSIQNASSLARLNREELAGSDMAQDNVQNAITKAFHDIENTGLSSEIGNTLEDTLRSEIRNAVANPSMSDMLMSNAERAYVEQVQATVFAAYDYDEPDNDNGALNL